MWNGINCRKFPRIKSKCEVDITLNGNVEHVSTVTENIGVGGICIILDKKVDKFAPVKLTLDIEDGLSPIECNGRIVWIIEKRVLGKGKTNYDVGIEFMGMIIIDNDRVKKFIISNER